MAGKGWGLLLLVAAGALAATAGPVLADHSGCPPFERLKYDYLVEFNHGGDLFSHVHVVGYTDFRFCYEMRSRILTEDVRFEARGGEYVVRVLGDDFEDTHVLRVGQNATAWYPRHTIDALQVLGVSSRLEPTVIPTEPPPLVLPRALRLG